MSRLPELEQELVMAAARLGRPPRRLARQVRVGALVVAAAVAVALLAVAGLNGERDERSGPRPAVGIAFGSHATLEDMFGVFRRPATPGDDTGASNRDLEKSGERQSGEDLSRSRRISAGGASGFIWPMTAGVCFSIAAPTGHGSSSSCARLDELQSRGLAVVFGGSQNTFGIGGVAVDGIREVRLTRSNGPDIVAPVTDNAFFIDASDARSTVEQLRWHYAGKERSINIGQALPDDTVPPVEPPVDDPTSTAPLSKIEPLAGSISRRLEFTIDGTRYTAVGFHARGSRICTALTDDATGISAGRGCLDERLLRQRLGRQPALLSSAGGLRNGGVVRDGFARAEVTELTPAGGSGDMTVVLSDPWRPEPWTGEPIRFLFVFTPNETSPPDSPGRIALPLTAHLDDGRTVQLP
jgi:hypothetical protein